MPTLPLNVSCIGKTLGGTLGPSEDRYGDSPPGP